MSLRCWGGYCVEHGSGADHLRPLDVTIGFSTTNRFSSWVLRKALYSPCSHAWVSYTDHDFRMRRVMQAEWYGYEDIPRACFDRKNIVIAEFKPLQEPLDKGVVAAALMLGADYDFKAALWLKLRRMLGWWSKNKIWGDPLKYMCSEAVARILQVSGYGISGDPEITSPRDLLDYCIDSSDAFKVIMGSPYLDEYVHRK